MVWLSFLLCGLLAAAADFEVTCEGGLSETCEELSQTQFLQRSITLDDVSRQSAPLQATAEPEKRTHWFVGVVNNPLGYKARYNLYWNFVRHVLEDLGANLLIVEGVYGHRRFVVTHKPPLDPSRMRYVKARAKSVLWHKENLVNLGIAALPPDCGYVTLVDVDLTFKRRDGGPRSSIVDLITDTLQRYPVAQTWVHGNLLGPGEKNILGNVSSFGARYVAWRERGEGLDGSSKKVHPNVTKKWHPGFAWSYRMDVLKALGGVFEAAVIGGGDRFMACSLIGLANTECPDEMPKGLHRAVEEWQARADPIVHANVGVVPLDIEHHFHGFKKDRNYRQRQAVLLRHEFDPAADLWHNKFGMLELAGNKEGLQEDILEYFRGRHEDAGLTLHIG